FPLLPLLPFPTRRSSDLLSSASFGSAQDGAAIVARVDDCRPRGHRGEVLSDLPAERLQRIDVGSLAAGKEAPRGRLVRRGYDERSEEHTSELQSRFDLVC